MGQAIPLIVLGVFATVSIVLYIGGCAITKNWYPLFVAIPVLLLCGAAYLFVATGPNGLQNGWIRKDTYLFYTLFFATCIIGLPLVFYHCDVIGWKGLVVHIAGDVCSVAGFITFMIPFSCSSVTIFAIAVK